MNFSIPRMFFSVVKVSNETHAISLLLGSMLGERKIFLGECDATNQTFFLLNGPN